MTMLRLLLATVLALAATILRAQPVPMPKDLPMSSGEQASVA